MFFRKKAKPKAPAEPRIAAKEAAIFELEVGTYWYCTCGFSEDQPFCDGAHAGTDFEPMPFEITEEKVYALCQCKRTGNAPFCDGVHAKLD
ncbi:MAG: CDGSH iron-sulfur domain-containing protein [Acidobacteriota bacterium]